MAHGKRSYDISYEMKIGSSIYYVLREPKKDQRNKYNFHVFDDRLIQSSKKGKKLSRAKSVIRRSETVERSRPSKQQSKNVHRSDSVPRQQVSSDIVDVNATITETINNEREKLVDSLRTTMATERDRLRQLIKKEITPIANQHEELIRLHEEQKQSLKKYTDKSSSALIKKTVKETLSAQKESSTTFEQLEEKLVQTIEREIRKVQPKTEVMEERDHEETITRLFVEQKQILDDALYRQQQQTTTVSHDLIKQAVAEALNSQREQQQQQSISHQNIERLEHKLTQVIQREIRETTKRTENIDVVTRSYNRHEQQASDRHNETTDGNIATLNHLLTEQRRALTDILAQQQPSLSLDFIKRAVREVLTEQNSTSSPVDGSKQHKKPAIITSREVEIRADIKQTRIDVAFQEQRNAIVSNKDLRDAVKQWSNVGTMGELVGKIKACGKNNLEYAWLLFCWIGQNIRYDLFCQNNAADSVFQQRTGVCRGFVSLYHECCSLLQIDCLEISGYAKQAFLKPGQDLKNSPHAWNAIVLDQYTYLLDPTWGAGGGDNTNELEDFYFLTSPEELIYTHYCNGHQLLDPEISKQDFLSLPVMKSTYYRLNLKLLSPKQGHNETNQNVFKIAIKVANEVDVFATLKVGDIEYPRNLHTLCQRDVSQADVLNCFIAPPADGLYEMAIYAKTKNETTYRDAIYMRLHVSDLVQAITFPLTYQPFSEHQCLLIEPLRRLVQQNERILIHMKIPNANVIKIHNGDDYIVPTKNEYKNGILKKEIQVQGDISVCGRWDDKADSISTICVFNMTCKNS